MKRGRTLENNDPSGQSYGGSSRSSERIDDINQHPVPICYTPAGNLSLSSGPLNVSRSVPRTSEVSARNSTIRSGSVLDNSIPFGTSSRNDSNPLMNSVIVLGERGSRVGEHHETRTIIQDQTDVVLAPGTSISNPIDLTGIQESQYHLDSSSSREAAGTSRRRSQSAQRSVASLANMPGDGTNHRRANAGGRRRRRRDNAVNDPSTNGVVELHDGNNGLRLDVENTSNEELSAVGQRIGNVGSGLSEEKILDSMHVWMYGGVEISPDSQQCCICQEVIGPGVAGGTLFCDCMTEFHLDCIIKWLLRRNVCPICRAIAIK